MTTAAYMRAYRALHKEGFGPLITCACGCGATFRQFSGYNREERRYKAGHNGKGRGHPQSEETKAKISAAMRGKTK